MRTWANNAVSKCKKMELMPTPHCCLAGQCCIKSAGNGIDTYGKEVLWGTGAVSNGLKIELVPTKIRPTWCVMLASERKYALLMPTLASFSLVINTEKQGKDAAWYMKIASNPCPIQSSIRKREGMIQQVRRDEGFHPDSTRYQYEGVSADLIPGTSQSSVEWL